MNLPRLTAESSIGPALNCYVNTATAQGRGPGGTAVEPMLSWNDITGALQGILGTIGNVVGDITSKIPCLLSCGIPNAIAIAPRCGFDVECWIEQGGSAAASCISKCLSS